MSRARIVNNLPQFIAARRQRGATAMAASLILGASEAAAMTPIDTSTLLNSQYKRVEIDGERIRGQVGYTASYAVPVHDPDHPQNFRRAGAEKEFLRKGFERAEPEIRKRLKDGLKA